MSKEEMIDHADTYSPAFNKTSYEKLQKGEIPQKDLYKYSSFWYKDFDEMAKKTMLRRLISKWGIMSIEMQKAFEADMAEINDDITPNYIDDSDINDLSDEADITEEVPQVEEEKNIKQVGINEL